MANHESSIADVIKDAVRDAQDLVRGEIALARAEAREEVSRLGMGVGLLAGAAVSAVVAMMLLMMTVAWAISELAGWPVWAGFGIVTLMMLLMAGVLAFAGRKRMSAERRMPRTMDTLKENMEWMRARTS
jgi:uncharacterized membrane protein YqjE